MANEPLRGVAPQVQPKPVVPQTAQPAPAADPVVTQPVASEAPAPVAAVETARERTQENFEKLLDSNSKLFQQNQANNILIQQLLQTTQQQQRQPQAPVAPMSTQQAAADALTDFIVKDPTTGEEYIDRQKMQNTLSTITQRLSRAEEVAQTATRQQQEQEKIRQEREAFNTYPNLDPRSSDYDGKFTRDTRAFLTDSMLNPNDYNGRPLSFKEAADLVRAGAQPTQQQVATATVAQQVEEIQSQAANAAPTANQINKVQASASVANQPPQAASDISDDELRRQQILTRTGDDTALAERLMHTDHIFGPNSGTGEQPR